MDAGADVHAKRVTGLTPLHRAAGWNNNPAVIQALVDAGADVDARDDDGDTPLDIAESRRNTAAIKVLQ